MIPKKYTGEMLKGRKARCLCDISNKGGHGISAGSTVTIVNVVRGKGLYVNYSVIELPSMIRFPGS